MNSKLAKLDVCRTCSKQGSAFKIALVLFALAGSVSVQAASASGLSGFPLRVRCRS